MWHKIIIAFGLTALLYSCGEDKPEPVKSYGKYVEPNSGLVLYAPRPYAVTATHVTNLAAGFRLEDLPNETLAGIVQTTTRQANVRGSATAPFTSPAFVKSALVNYVSDIKKNITLILPGSNPDESAGDWTLTTLRLDTTVDRMGQSVAYGHFSLQYAPVYQLRTYQMLQYLAAIVLKLNWAGFPVNKDKYFAAGNSTIQFAIALSAYTPQGFFGGSDDSKKVAVSIAAFPGNKSAASIANSLDDLLTFKTLGTVKDKLVEKEKVFVVEKGAPPLDIVFALDRNASMVEEAPRYRKELTDMISGLYKAGEYDLRVGFLTNDGPEFVRLKDGKPFVSPNSTDPSVLVRAVLDEIWSTATGLPEDFVVNNLLFNTALAVTGTTNPGFRRFDAPLLLFYLSDRDDQSTKLDGSALSNQATYYKTKLQEYDHSIIIAPVAADCIGADYSAQSEAPRLATLSAHLGHYFQDLCKNNHFAYKREVDTWAEGAVSFFTFEAPQPMVFTLDVFLNGTPVPQLITEGYAYDPLSDSLSFAAAVKPQGGDTVRARYLTLETPQLPARE